jgi:hypothetical protein
MKIGTIDALLELCPDAEFVLFDDKITEWHSSGITQPSEDVINAKVTELTNAESMRLLREERDRLIGQSDWRIVKAKETSTNIPTAWKTYRQALRDLPASSTPKLDSDDNLDMSSVTWPTPPS